ncbi:TonB protein C-terminal [Flavobacterium fluvii]|uniref:TonB protein C-terminal n=1 Tax=Flavobacterium fluvii TaxID=468056 RepID=A0A1M5DNL3_9FLAO|nr:energy transducer TonB [Flavobacterium fluvii]SHF68563.1 TonB protein C-terminal [Flavobacterium fluvii]
MKNLLYVILAFFVIRIVSAQETPIISNDNLYDTAGIEIKPEFPGGIKEFYKFIGENYKSPPTPGLKGKIYVSFIIEKDGSVTEIKVLKEIGYGTGEEAIRVLSKCPNWIPGVQNGRKVRCSYSLPISIQNPIESKPEFPGGMNGIYAFIAKNYQIPKVEGLAGKVYVTFAVDVDGSLVDIRVLRDIGYGTGREAIRVLKMCPKWKPAELDGKPVKCTFSLPINITSR